MEAKRLGDMAVTEGWAMLMRAPRRPSRPGSTAASTSRASRRLANDGAVTLLYFVRRYCAKLLYEIEFFQADDPASMRPRYAELLTEALKLPGEPRELPRRHRRLVLRHRLPALVGVRGAAARVPAQRVRERLVRAARGRRPAARALVARPGPDRRRAAVATSPARRSRWRRSPSASARASAADPGPARVLILFSPLQVIGLSGRR